MRRRMRDESGSALITALIATVLMLGLGLALLAIVDTQANQSAQERTRDQGFNLSESVLNSEAFVLGRNWPQTGAALACGAAGAGFDDTIGQSTGTTDDAKRLRNNLDASYTDTAYDGAKWQVNICDDDGTAVWHDSLLANKTFDDNDNDKLWVRAQSFVGGKTRVLVGLVQVSENPAVDPRYGLVTGSLSEDLGSATSAITNATVLSGLTSNLLNSNPPVGADPSHPLPESGITGVRCGLLDNIGELKTCVTGAVGALSAIPAVDTLVNGGKLQQYPSTTSADPNAIGQLRTKAKDDTTSNVYIPMAPGGSRTSAPSCGIVAPNDPDTIVFIEKVGNGDQYCVLNVSSSVRYRALVIGSGRVIIRGNDQITSYDTEGTNRFTGVIYALNLQTADQTASTPTRELVRIEKGARVRGAVHADGRNAQVGLIAPDFNTTTLVNTLLGCPSGCLLANTLTGLLGTLGVNGVLDALINGQCLVSLPILGCTLRLPPLAGGVTSVLAGITAQLTGYGSAIHSDVDVIENLKVYGASGVTPGTFRDLAAQ